MLVVSPHICFGLCRRIFPLRVDIDSGKSAGLQATAARRIDNTVEQMTSRLTDLFLSLA